MSVAAAFCCPYCRPKPTPDGLCGRQCPAVSLLTSIPRGSGAFASEIRRTKAPMYGYVGKPDQLNSTPVKIFTWRQEFIDYTKIVGPAATRTSGRLESSSNTPYSTLSSAFFSLQKYSQLFIDQQKSEFKIN